MTSPATRGRVTTAYPALAYPAFARYLVGQVLSGFGTWFQIVAQSLLILEISNSGTALGIAAALQYLPVLLFSPYAGVIIDRLPARRILLMTNSLAAVLATVLGTVTALGHVTTGWVWALAPGLGLVMAFDRPAQAAIIAELVPTEARSTASALSNVQNASGRLVGPAVAGILYAAVGPALCFLLNGASYLVILVALARIRPSELIPRPRKLAIGAVAELRAGLAYVRRAPAVRAPLVCAAAMGLMTFNFLTVIPSMITFTFQAGGRAFGLCETLNAGASVLGGLWIAPRLGQPTRRQLAFACGLFTIAMLGNAVMPTLVWFAIWMPIFGVCFIIFQTTITALLQTRSEPAFLGRVMSLYTLGIFGTTPLGALGTGWLIDHYSPRVAMGAGAVATLGSALWLWLVTPTDVPPTDVPLVGPPPAGSPAPVVG